MRCQICRHPAVEVRTYPIPALNMPLCANCRDKIEEVKRRKKEQRTTRRPQG